MLEARELHCERDERTLFRGLSFTVDAGEWVQVTGGNGAGKTTLLRLLTGLARLTRRMAEHTAQGGMVILTTHQPLPGAADAVRRLALTGGGAGL
ncbi:ATP-binding cassette domain-containing protein [Salmonella enterica]|uniref:ATP-binding cassette domain-containing protein n=1 Tax=Salmonella enterica subsp. salamae TaxID=59202 RepID=A0A8F7YJ37_SALER|nr:ATP-binding cassette domain-containing protein [Salmonella enterica]QXX23062.1 ATP-binding cassette domain-containing protein [Salmonella enterica subsp. salamae]